ncbi:hypothetical protein ACFPYJ_32345 [Paenibacillus solisilvae]|uniref:DUF2680 domain-containing protein n=1 Tax=Paenibacillus solisilvae TaxID=2486751 RepID=A0ABW0W9H4_9BACL
MNKYLKTISITAALAVMIPLSASAAASNTTTETSTSSAVKVDQSGSGLIDRGGDHGGRPGFRGQYFNEAVLALLKLDRDTLQEKLNAGSTLGEIATAQGVTTEALKAALTTAFEERQAQEEKEFTANLDTMISSKQQFKGGPGLGGGHYLSTIATAIGLTEDELRTALQAEGATIASIAKTKGVTTDALISKVKAAIVTQIDQAATDGKLTAEQAAAAKEKAGEQAKRAVEGNFGPKDGFRGGGGHADKGGSIGNQTSATTE